MVVVYPPNRANKHAREEEGGGGGRMRIMSECRKIYFQASQHKSNSWIHKTMGGGSKAISIEHNLPMSLVLCRLHVGHAFVEMGVGGV